jgi:ABC-type dipeptide/oligopeptide/nickel transport system permease component
VLRYLARRLGTALLTLWVVTTGTFALLHAVPGGPFANPKLTPAARRDLEVLYGLGRPLWQQYLQYLGDLARGRLGSSLVDAHRTVAQVIAQGFPVSAALGLEALGWAVTGGVALGLWAALRRHGPGDHAVLAASVLGLAVPNFVVAALVDYLFGVRWPVLPVAGWGTAADTVLPAFSLGVGVLALVARLVRARAADVLRADYVRTARAAGLPWRQVLLRHVLRNALVPVLGVFGPLAAGILTGSFVVEQVFAIPGLGSAYVTSVEDRDYPLVLGTTVFYAVLLLGLNLLADLALAWLDPRVRLGEEG